MKSSRVASGLGPGLLAKLLCDAVNALGSVDGEIARYIRSCRESAQARVLSELARPDDRAT